MVLLIGNYRPDHQPSMLRFNDMMRQGLLAAGIDAELVRPNQLLGKLASPFSFAGKWLAYIDKYIFFPFQLRRELRRAPAIVHICDHSNAVYVKRCLPNPVLVTCHDLLAVRGGLGEETDCPASLTGRFLQRWILRGLQKASAVACISQATSADAHRLVAGAKGRPRISVVYVSLSPQFRKLPDAVVQARLREIPGLDLNRPFVLHVGSNLRRKNRDGVLRIFARCQNKWPGQLVFVGERLNEELMSLARTLGIFDRVVQVSNANDESLAALFNHAVALLFPSRFEGFGWPIIEAQACGCPAICTNSGPMPEAAGDAGLLHDVEDEEGFASDLLRLTDPTERARWSEKSLQNAERFSAEKMIAQYIDIYRQLGAAL